ncbi:MAG: beta-ketoacyl-ACP synthase [Pseudomonadaceae bacterium]|nr:beta-ketoacyl-ACP synthase [Pseudomonadaceae bacterium]
MTVTIAAYSLTSALGTGIAGMRTGLAAGESPLTSSPWPGCDVECFLGRVDGVSLDAVEASRRSRNNALIELGLAQDDFAATVASARSEFGADRLGVIMGTSTSSIDRTEAGYHDLDAADRFASDYRQPRTHNPHAPGDYLASRIGARGPCITISAACASSAKVFATGKRWLEQGLADAVVVAGADSLCLSIIYGFHSLQLVSPERCRPFSQNRSGISLGEAAGFVLLTRDSDAQRPRVLGVGESCDAYHMSSAHPEGLGARLCMERALADGGIGLADVGYVNLHGTGTRANDETEGAVLAAMLAEAKPSQQPLVSATKGWTGHTLGAAGIVEAILCLNALETSVVPGTMNTTDPDAQFEVLLESCEAAVEVAMTNSFGFGGNNASVVFAR